MAYWKNTKKVKIIKRRKKYTKNKKQKQNNTNKQNSKGIPQRVAKSSYLKKNKKTAIIILLPYVDTSAQWKLSVLIKMYILWYYFPYCWADMSDIKKRRRVLYYYNIWYCHKNVPFMYLLSLCSLWARAPEFLYFKFLMIKNIPYICSRTISLL